MKKIIPFKDSDKQYDLVEIEKETDKEIQAGSKVKYLAETTWAYKKGKIYQLDLNDGFNKKYKSETSNPDAKSINELKFGKLTLIKVKNGNIVKYIENKDDIRSELNI